VTHQLRAGAARREALRGRGQRQRSSPARVAFQCGRSDLDPRSTVVISSKNNALLHVSSRRRNGGMAAE